MNQYAIYNMNAKLFYINKNHRIKIKILKVEEDKICKVNLLIKIIKKRR